MNGNESAALSGSASAPTTTSADLATHSSRELALLDKIEGRAKSGVVIGVILFAVGVLTFAVSSSGTARLLGGLAIFCGFGLVWSLVRYRRLLVGARESLKESPLDLLFERRFQLSRVQAFRARLWTLDSEERPLAWFGSMQWSAPMFMTADRVPAQVYGAPTHGAAVVVSCSEGLLLGRINLSRFDDDSRPAGAPPRGLGWLFKPRHVRLP